MKKKHAPCPRCGAEYDPSPEDAGRCNACFNPFVTEPPTNEDE